MNLAEYATSSDCGIESQVLSKILCTRKIPHGLIPEYFTGFRKPLFETILNQWNKHNEIDNKILANLHTEAFDSVVNSDPTYSCSAIEILHEHWMRRTAGCAIAEVKSDGNVGDELRNLQSKISEIILKGAGKEYDHRKSVLRLIESIELAQSAKRSISGFSTGIKAIDEATNGIERGKVYAIGALKKSGKSRFSVYLSCVVRAMGAGVYWNSLEMNDFQLNTVALGYYTGLDTNMFTTPLTQANFLKLKDGLDDLGKLDWLIYSDYYVSDLKARIIECRNKHKIDVCFIDFIQRMKSKKYANDRTREVENVIMDLANMAREIDVAVVVLSQFSKEAEKLEIDEVPSMMHFKESQGIAENADSIWSICKPLRKEEKCDYYKPDFFRMRVEQRYGISDVIIPFVGDMRNGRFSDATEDQIKEFSEKKQYQNRKNVKEDW